MQGARLSQIRNLPAWRRRLMRRWRSAPLIPVIELVALSLFAGMLAASYWIIGARQGNDALLPSTLTTMLLIGTLVPGMALLVLVGRRVAMRKAARRPTGAGSSVPGRAKLHVRLVALFSTIAAIPTLLVVLFASLLFQSGVEFWFSDRARGMLESANQLARGYYDQNLRDIGNESLAMAGDLRDYLGQVRIDSPEFAEAYSFQVVGRKLNESAIVEMGANGELRTAAIVDPDENDRRQRVTAPMVQRLQDGEAVIVAASARRIEAVTALDLDAGIYLYAARSSDLLALSQWERAQQVLASYDQLAGRARALQLRFNLALFLISLALVGLAVWMALRFADRLAAPLGDLANAAREVGRGNFSPRLSTIERDDEIGVVGRAFNRMAERLSAQTRELVRANAQLDDRRAFMEAVLESVSAGVVSLDSEGRVRLINGAAQRLLLGGTERAYLGEPLASLSPVLAEFADSGQGRGIIQLSDRDDLTTLAVRIAREPIGKVITFEDITRQLLDQRQAAWSDVARRIAHEIKNPLTPIQLAAERLRRRYAGRLDEDDGTFGQLTETIVRQVGDLRRMVDEFSSFARMPKPVFRVEPLGEIVRQAVFLQDVAHARIAFEVEERGSQGDGAPIRLPCDRRLLGQALTNMLKNGVEAIEARQAAEPEHEGRITVRSAEAHGWVVLSVSDNGIGLPADSERLVEPYMTTREKGTGLGLAIVKKIVEQHQGELSFAPSPDGGATVTMRFDRAAIERLHDSTAATAGPAAPAIAPKSAIGNTTG